MRALVALVMLLAASGCAPKEGRHCSASTLATCADKTSALVCVDGSYSRAICGGPQGCTPRRDGVSCDDTAAVAGPSPSPARERRPRRVISAVSGEGFASGRREAAGKAAKLGSGRRSRTSVR